MVGSSDDARLQCRVIYTTKRNFFYVCVLTTTKILGVPGSNLVQLITDNNPGVSVIRGRGSDIIKTSQSKITSL